MHIAGCSCGCGGFCSCRFGDGRAGARLACRTPIGRPAILARAWLILAKKAPPSRDSVGVGKGWRGVCVSGVPFTREGVWHRLGAAALAVCALPCAWFKDALGVRSDLPELLEGPRVHPVCRCGVVDVRLGVGHGRPENGREPVVPRGRWGVHGFSFPSGGGRLPRPVLCVELGGVVWGVSFQINSQRFAKPRARCHPPLDSSAAQGWALPRFFFLVRRGLGVCSGGSNAGPSIFPRGAPGRWRWRRPCPGVCPRSLRASRSQRRRPRTLCGAQRVS